MSVYASQGMSYGMACLMVAGVLFTLMGALLLLLVAVRVRGERRRVGARHGRAEAAAVRAQAKLDRRNAAILRKVAQRDRAGRRTPSASRLPWGYERPTLEGLPPLPGSAARERDRRDPRRRGAPWSSTGMNMLLLLLLLAPYSDRLLLHV